MTSETGRCVICGDECVTIETANDPVDGIATATLVSVPIWLIAIPVWLGLLGFLKWVFG